jgi:DNA-binding response OmpR family regulator
MVSIKETKTSHKGREEDVYDDGCLRVEHDNYYAACHKRLISLTRAEFLILSKLVRNPGRYIESKGLWDYIWKDRKPYNPESLHVFIYRLRNKLEPYHIVIETMVAVGYRILPAQFSDERVD